MKLRIVTFVFLATAAAHAAGAGEVGFSAVPQATTADHAFSTVVCAYDPEGKYLRQVIPASPALPASKRKGWPRMTAEGIGEMPIVGHVLSRSTYPAFSVDYDCFPAVAPDGRFLVLNNANGRVKHADLGRGRTLLTVGPDGSVPADYMARRIAGSDHRGSGHVALSPDGKFAYVAGLYVKKKGACNTIWRTPLDRVGQAEIFAGRSFQKPKKASDLSDPQGLDTDRHGNLYVADRGRGRIAVFDSKGAFIAGIPLKNVYQVQVSAKTGAIFATIVIKNRISRIIKLRQQT